MPMQPRHTIVPLRAETRHMSCLNCEARQRCLPAGMDDADCTRVDHLVLQRYRLLRNDTLYQMNDCVRGRLYAIRSGQFKSYRLSTGGEQRIVGLPEQGELLGVDVLGQERHASAATATRDSVLCELSHPRLLEGARHLPALALRLERILSKELAREQRLALLLGYQRATQKIAGFLSEMAWSRIQNQARNVVQLDLTRQDLGDYLGLTDATVTRQLLGLQRIGVLSVDRRRISIIDRPRLATLAAGAGTGGAKSERAARNRQGG